MVYYWIRSVDSHGSVLDDGLDCFRRCRLQSRASRGQAFVPPGAMGHPQHHRYLLANAPSLVGQPAQGLACFCRKHTEPSPTYDAIYRSCLAAFIFFFIF